jgi:hypothetical protein
MGAVKKDLQLLVTGGIYQVTQTYYSVSTPSQAKQAFTIVVHNQSGEWIDLNIDRAQGGVASTGHIQNGQSGGLSESILFYLGGDSKITRWRPGLFRIPGNGGGDITVEQMWLPQEAESVFIELTIKG